VKFSRLRSSLAWQCWHHHFRGVGHDQSSLGTFWRCLRMQHCLF
jgi:hypothetical protein